MPQTMIVSSEQTSNRHGDAIVVTTPLDAIIRLERPLRIQTVVLAGSYATNLELASFLLEFYPSIRLEREV